MRFWRCLAMVGAIGGAAAAQEARVPPYWASIAASEALMRTGPGTDYPAAWAYHRADLPIRVVARHQSWRKVEEPDGTQGWMAVVLLSDQRTGIVTNGEQLLRAEPRPGAPVVHRVAQGVVGRLSRCAGGWCRFDVKGRAGYIETAHLWGVERDEAFD